VTEKATCGGGENVPGVKDAAVDYMGGRLDNPT
jgi:hypothetical protein